MIHILISLLVFCLIAGVVMYIARMVMSAFATPQPFANIAYACVLMILLVLFLNEIGWAGAAHSWRTW